MIRGKVILSTRIFIVYIVIYFSAIFSSCMKQTPSLMDYSIEAKVRYNHHAGSFIGITGSVVDELYLKFGEELLSPLICEDIQELKILNEIKANCKCLLLGYNKYKLTDSIRNVSNNYQIECMDYYNLTDEYYKVIDSIEYLIEIDQSSRKEGIKKKIRYADSLAFLFIEKNFNTIIENKYLDKEKAEKLWILHLHNTGYSSECDFLIYKNMLKGINRGIFSIQQLGITIIRHLGLIGYKGDIDEFINSSNSKNSETELMLRDLLKIINYDTYSIK